MSELKDPSKVTIQSRQVTPLPIGSGGNNTTTTAMNNTNTQLTMLNAQSSMDTKYDPPPPKHATSQVISGFCSGSGLTTSEIIGIIGGILIVYGIIAK